MSKNNILHLFLKGIFLNIEIICYYYYYFVLRMYRSAAFQVSNRKVITLFLYLYNKGPFFPLLLVLHCLCICGFE